MKSFFKFSFSNSNIWKGIAPHAGLALLRVYTGLAFCLVFEKLFPKNGIWGPQEWFVSDVGHMGFPFPAFFAWLAVCIEFFGGVLLVLGLWTRWAALANAGVTFVAAIIYHKGDIAQSGLMAFTFFILCTGIFLSGPGRYSLDKYLFFSGKKAQIISVFLLLFLCFSGMEMKAGPALMFNCTGVRECKETTIEIKIRNPHWYPVQKTIIIYQPSTTGNQTREVWFWPLCKRSFSWEEGSSVYIADEKQVGKVMSGKNILSDKPFIVLSDCLNGQTFTLPKSE